MAELSDYAENEVLDWLLTAGSATRPTEWHVALYSVAPTDAGGGTELSGNGYARAAVKFDTPASRATNNTDAPSFTATGGDWAEAVAFGIFDASTSGNLLAWSPLTSNRTVLDGQTWQFDIGDITVTMSAGNFSDFAANLCLAWLLTDGTATRPTSWHVSLHQANGTELTGDGYARQSTTFGAASGGVTSNTTQELFTSNAGAWVEATQMGIYDASSSGNQIALGDLATPRTNTAGGTLPLEIGDLTVTLQ